MKDKRVVIAVDGYSSTGKSTISKMLAEHLGYTYIDTGAMYRMVTLGALKEELINKGEIDEERLKSALVRWSFDFKYNIESGGYDSYLNGVLVEREIRGMDVSNLVSRIAAIPFVRDLLVEKQRKLADSKSVIMDGRDIGSVVFPDADIKFFMTSSPEIRAERRYEELKAKGEKITYEEVEENIRVRDHIDESREVGPLRRTPDAILINSDTMSVDEVFEKMLNVVLKYNESRDR